MDAKGAVWLRGSTYGLAIVVFCLGFMLAVQFKVQQSIARDVSVGRATDLTRQLQQAEADRKQLTEEVTALRLRVANQSRGEELQQQLLSDLETAQMLAGLTEVRGPGVTVILDDSKRPVRPGENPNAYILHDEDLLRVINELRAGGAEAIAINGHRLTSRSEVRCTGPTITINGYRTAPPVVIQAIGDPQVLDASLRLRGGIIDSLAFWGIQVSIKKEGDLLIPAYKGPTRFQFARPARKEG